MQVCNCAAREIFINRHTQTHSPRYFMLHSTDTESVKAFCRHKDRLVKADIKRVLAMRQQAGERDCVGRMQI